MAWAASCSCAALQGEELFQTGKREEPLLFPNWKNFAVKHSIGV